MTKSTITREHLQEMLEWCEVFRRHPRLDDIAEAIRMALAAMDSEPVFTLQVSQAGYKGQKLGNHFGFITLDAARELDEGNYQLYRHAQQPVVLDRSIFENWWESQNGSPIDGWDSLRTIDGYCDDGIDGQFEAWNACRAAMLQGAKNSESRCGIQTAPALDSSPKTAESRCGNSPVIPEGYVMVPMRLTAENGAKGALSGEFSETKFVNCPECFGDDECETCDGSGRIEIKVPVSWTTIKEIWIKGVEHFAAAPQENN
ncbi:hypothetical protein [Klebsiella michiganensis]